MIDFDELKALCERATPGPWMHTPGYYNDSGGQYDQIDSPVEIISGEWGGPSGDNAAFIAAANPATILALLSANREMREAVSVLDAALYRIAAANPGSTNSETAKDMAEWSHCVAVVALCDASVVKARSALTTQRGDGE